MDSRSEDLEDPFSDSSLISLFPRALSHHNPGPDLVLKDSPESLRPIFDSMVLKNPRRFMEEAKSVRDSLKVDTVEIMRGEDENLEGEVENVENARHEEDTVGDLPGVSNENLQGRRPGLGRKKARFSLKPNLSQSVECLETTVDIEKIRDPEEYFLALEKHENAMNELRRQSGRPLMELDQNAHHLAERRRRPGLLRKPASYKHRFSMAPTSGDDNAFLSSQEALSQDLCSPTPSNHCLQTENTDKIPVPSTRELSGSMVAERDRPDDVSEEVQFGEDIDDESDDIIGMLKERFKPIAISKSCLPDLHNVLQSEFMTLGDSLQDSQDKMSDMHGIVSAIGKETTLGCNDMKRSLGHPSTSLTSPKSPYSSISLLKARLHQSRQGIDRFSALDIDLSPLGKAASCKDTHDLALRDLEGSVRSKKMQSISTANTMHIGPGHASGGTDTMETNEYRSECNVASKDTHDLAAAKFVSPEKSISGDSVMPAVLSDSIKNVELDHEIVEHIERDKDPNSPLHEKESDTADTMDIVKDSSKTLDVFSDGAVPIELDHAIRRDQSPKPAAHEKEINVVHIKGIHDLDAENLAPSNAAINDNSTISGIALDTTPHVELDHDISGNDTGDRVIEDNPSEVFDHAVTDNQHTESDGRVAQEDVQGGDVEKSSCKKKQSTATEDLARDRRSSGHDKPSSNQVLPLQKTPKASSKTSEDKKRKAMAPPPERRIAKAASKQSREFKDYSRRKSLAACGTRWETGTRRSTRIRTRPLEYWRGERQLYGRIHDSLVTVIGAKYFSPTKVAGPATLKVKSYVSDEYKEIVERAALH